MGQDGHTFLQNGQPSNSYSSSVSSGRLKLPTEEVSVTFWLLKRATEYLQVHAKVFT